jgi:hypothetical protein
MMKLDELFNDVLVAQVAGLGSLYWTELACSKMSSIYSCHMLIRGSNPYENNANMLC